MKYKKEHLQEFDAAFTTYQKHERKMVKRITEVVDIIHDYFNLLPPSSIRAGSQGTTNGIFYTEYIDGVGFVNYNFYGKSYAEEAASRAALAFKTIDLSYGFPVDLLFMSKSEIHKYLSNIK